MTTPPDTSPATASRIDRLAARIGVLRPSNASTDTCVATMEARVVRSELERRLGAVTLDLRTDGAPIGPWLPRHLAAWPSDIDVAIDLADLDGEPHELVSMFGRTVEPVAAEVRERMLRFLSILPGDDRPLTDELLAQLLPPPARPTDVWLVVRTASAVTTSEAAHRLLRLEPGNEVFERLDRWFDAVSGSFVRSEATVARLSADVAELRTRLAAAEDELLRSERLAVERLTDLEAERAALREQLERSWLDIDHRAAP